MDDFRSLGLSCTHCGAEIAARRIGAEWREQPRANEPVDYGPLFEGAMK